ncbi:MAG: hypothetical protein CENE_02364 [Candidatus Celerinatantimonas neptuna]|nr:MAG: hypothetical protein CENE_02364 [Candidatus Celerinatantimonas neptuna]
MSEPMEQWRAPSALTIYEAQELGQLWGDELKWACSWELDLSDTEEIDSCGIQLLLYLHDRLEEHDRQLQISHVSGDVFEIFRLVGIDRTLSIKGVASDE